MLDFSKKLLLLFFLFNAVETSKAVPSFSVLVNTENLTRVAAFASRVALRTANTGTKIVIVFLCVFKKLIDLLKKTFLPSSPQCSEGASDRQIRSDAGPVTDSHKCELSASVQQFGGARWRVHRIFACFLPFCEQTTETQPLVVAVFEN